MNNKKLKWNERPVTWGGYAKFSVICIIISFIAMIIEFGWIFGWFSKGYEAVKDLKNRIFHKETSEETEENEEERA